MAVPILLGTVLVAYLLGAVPLAQLVSRRGGVDIFSSGTGLGGASNVRKNLGKRAAGIVLAGDIGKGALSVLLGRAVGIEDPWILLPAAAAIMGHWNSVFVGFRGGDGLGTLGGIILALFPIYGMISLAVAGVVSLGGQKVAYSSLLNVVFGYLALAMFSLVYYGDRVLTAGVGVLAAVVLAHAIRGHLRRRRSVEWVDVIEAGGAVEHTRP